MKKFLLGMIIGILITAAGMTFAAQNIRLIINDQEVYGDIAPQVVNGHILVPARAVAEAFGATVIYNKAKNTITITGGNNGGSDIQNDDPQNGNPGSGKVYLFKDIEPFNTHANPPERVSISGRVVEGYNIQAMNNGSFIYFKLDGKYKKLVLYTGAVDGYTYGGQLTFETSGGKLLKQIGGVPPEDGLKKFEINVAGVDVLRLSSYTTQWNNPSYLVNAYLE